MDTELQQFKTAIDLTVFAADRGYLVDRGSTSRTSAAMVHPDTGDKVLISRQPDGHWVFCSVRGRGDRGTVLDFVMARESCGLGKARQFLRAWLGTSAGGQPAGARRLPELPSLPTALPHDPSVVQEAWAAAVTLDGEHAYLTRTRKIPAAVYMGPTFRGRLRIDRRDNVLFPHWTGKGDVCGFEMKNHGFTGFAKQGRKGLFVSVPAATDNRLVIAETAIDALSYATLFGVEGGRFLSTAGAMSPLQVSFLRSAMLRMPGGEVVAATDHDAAGFAIAEQFREIFDALPREDLRFRIHQPKIAEADWNETLCVAS